MNIIFVYDFAFINGGAARIAISEAIGMAQAGYNVTFFSGVGPVDERLQTNGVNVVCLEQSELKRLLNKSRDRIAGVLQGIWNKKALREFTRVLSQYNSNDTIVFFHGWSLALSPALLAETAKRKFHIAIMCHDYELLCPNRTSFNFRRRKTCIYRPMSAKCCLINCDKRSYAQKIYRIIRQWLARNLLKKNRVALIYYSKNAESQFKLHYPYTYGGYFVPILVDFPAHLLVEPYKNNRYLFIGRLSPEKGVDMFCEAVTQSGVEADVIGTGEDIDVLRVRYPNINFHGWLTSEEMAVHIQNARCLIVTSLWKETGPLNVLETQVSYRLPCIVPLECGVSDTVELYHTGYLYEMGDYQALCKCIEYSKDDKEIALMSANCEKLKYEKYLKRTHVMKLNEIFCSIMNDHI